MNQTHPHTVAYPGPPGSHAAAAAAALFPRETLVPVGGFHAVADAVACADAAHGVLPIESSLAGTVAETHDLLNEHALSIVAEAVLPIHHVLAASAQVPLDEIRIVRSHPTALEQCRGLLKRMPRATAMPAATTAEAAREAAEIGDPTVAAIAGAGAAARCARGRRAVQPVEDQRASVGMESHRGQNADPRRFERRHAVD